MFKKLLKYDMKSIVNVWWILAISVFGASFVGAFILRFLVEVMPTAKGIETLFCIVGMLMLILLIIGITASVVVTEVLVYYRFYKNFFTDEGYLTFTLPVSRKMLFLSKTANAVIWMGAHGLLLVLCGAVFALFGFPSENGLINLEVFEWIGKTIGDVWATVGPWMLLYLLQGLAILLCAMVFSASLIHFCITTGAVIAKKAKLLAAIGIYYLVNMIISSASQILMVFGMEGIVGITMKMADASAPMTCIMVAVLLFVMLFLAATLALTMYFMTLSKLERKLNLA